MSNKKLPPNNLVREFERIPLISSDKMSKIRCAQIAVDYAEAEKNKIVHKVQKLLKELSESCKSANKNHMHGLANDLSDQCKGVRKVIKILKNES